MDSLEPPSKKRRTNSISSLGDEDKTGGQRAPSHAALLAACEINVTPPETIPAEDRIKRDILLGITAPPTYLTNKEDKIEPSIIQPKNATVRSLYDIKEEDETALLCGPQRYHCDACQKDISDVFRVKCSECRDFDLCVPCFCAGVETGSHINTHGYLPIGRNDFSLFTEDWNADEEMMLLEGVSKFGFGNWSVSRSGWDMDEMPVSLHWDNVADLVSPYSSQGKKKHECEVHYYSVHIEPYRDKVKHVEVMPRIGPKEVIVEVRQRLHEKMIGENHPKPPPLIFPPQNTNYNVVGYMPLRGDFDIEYENDAELILADIEFRGDETPQERELKLKILDIYNAKLDERVLRKRVVIEKGLADWRRLQQLDKRRTKEESDLHNLFRLLVRYDLIPDHDEFLQLFIHQRKIKERLLLLQEWRSLGLRTYEEVEAYENVKVSTVCGLPHQSLSIPTTETNGSLINLTSNRLPPRRTSHIPGSQNHDASSMSATSSTGMFSLEASASKYPCGNLLTEKELEFCDTMQIPPIYFLVTKHTLLRSISEFGNPISLQQQKEIRLDGSKQCSLYDFALHAKFELPSPVELPYTISGRLGSILSSQPDGSILPSPTASRKTRRRRMVVDSPPGSPKPLLPSASPSLIPSTTRTVPISTTTEMGPVESSEDTALAVHNGPPLTLQPSDDSNME